MPLYHQHTLLLGRLHGATYLYSTTPSYHRHIRLQGHLRGDAFQIGAIVFLRTKIQQPDLRHSAVRRFDACIPVRLDHHQRM